MSNIIVESLKRLYNNDSLSQEQIDCVKDSADKLLQANKITVEEHLYILRKDGE